MPGPYDKGGWDPLQTFGYEALSVTSGAAVPPTTATIANAYRAIYTVETADVRFRADGTAPTGTVGVPLKAGDEITIYGNDCRAVQFIAIGASATVHAHYAR